MRYRASLQGGISVLIILMMITLSIFGLLALYSARSNYKLAERNAEWTTKYYALDTYARQETARLDDLSRGFSDGAPTEAEVEAMGALGWTVLAREPLTVARKVSQDTMHIEIELALNTATDRPTWDVLAWRETQDGFDYNVGQDLFDPVAN